jgi:phosphatidylinositol 3-kinase
MFAIEFVKACDNILKSCGLDLKMLTFDCIPVGKNKGFIEWVHGCVPLSEIFQATSLFGRKKSANSISSSNKVSPAFESPSTIADTNSARDGRLSSVARAGISSYESLQKMTSGLAAGVGGGSKNIKTSNSSDESSKQELISNPIQDYLRSFAYDANSPYMIRKQAMDIYVKSCAGYCAITYILGVGDRHLDNLLLHQTGHFFHCDFSFILGNDPKKYLPLRISHDMVNGMGGRNSDNFCMFLSLTCAAFLTLRRPDNVRYLLSLVRMMEGFSLPDLEEKQSLETAILGIRKRLRLDLTEDEAISFMEKLVEDSCASRMWIAVDAIHTLGKRF